MGLCWVIWNLLSYHKADTNCFLFILFFLCLILYCLRVCVDHVHLAEMQVKKKRLCGLLFHLVFSQRCSVFGITFITFTFSLQRATLTNDTKDKEYTPHDLPQRQSVQPQETCSIARRAKRMRSEVSLISSFVC